jgi:manganese transport protein
MNSLAVAARPVRATLPLLGPAFVAAVAYVDPGNFATNVAAGSSYGYQLVWVLVVANAIAMLVQYLSAKLGLATGASLPQLCREELPRPLAVGLWVQAELVAFATDLAEVLGGGVALYLLVGLPLLTGGLVTGAAAFAILALRLRRFEAAVATLLAVVLVAFAVSVAHSGVSLSGLGAGLLPRLTGGDSLLLAAGMLGATVMPHVVYLHSALVRDRFGRAPQLLGTTRVDVVVALGIAGVVNIAMLVLATTLPVGADSLDGAHAALRGSLGSGVATLFAVALLASGLASASVGTYAGAVIMAGFLRRSVPLAVRRLVTLVPAFVVLAVGVDPSRALVLSQVVLSFGVPFALWPLVWLTARGDVMGGLVNARRTTAAAAAAATVVTALNAALVAAIVTT